MSDKVIRNSLSVFFRYYNPRIHYENGRDVERQDGVLATVNIVSRGAHRGFYFTVWYGQNPNVQ